MRITKLRKEGDYWRARASADGRTIEVDNRYGSWQAVVGQERREVMPQVAAVLQGKLPSAAKMTRRR